MHAGKIPTIILRLRWTHAAALLVCATLAGPLLAQAEQHDAAPPAGTIAGTVKDPSGAVIAGAVVTIEGGTIEGNTIEGGAPQSQAHQQRTAITDQNGQFQFSGIPAGAYQVTITASGFQAWTAQGVSPGSRENPAGISAILQVAAASSQVNVGLPPRELAAQQLKEEEKQRVAYVFPNFFVAYEPNAAPLTVKQKFQLGWKTFFDPVPILFSAVGAGFQQARDRFPEYGEGVEGFAKRFGANYADRVDSVLIGHVVMQSVFHQDPRYFYKGTGSFGSRALYAIGTAFVAKGDNGHWQPAYADVLGGVASYELSTLYRPGTSRPVLRLEHTILLGFAGRAARNLFQEFLLSKVTTHIPKNSRLASQLVLRAGTQVTLISAEDLSAKANANPEPIEFRLASDLQVDGVVVAKAGSHAEGRATYAAGPGENGLKVDLERMHLTVGKVEVPLRSTQVRGGSGLNYHRLENSSRIVIEMYVDTDATVAPAQESLTAR